MRPHLFRNMVIRPQPFEEPLGVWWPNATITAPETGDTALVSLAKPERSQMAATVSAIREARLRIINDRWRD